MAVWTGAMGAGLQAFQSKRVARLDDLKYWGANTRAIQLRTLRGLLRTASGTEYGKEHRFARLAQLPENELHTAYRETTPIVAYADLKAQLERMRIGAEPDVCWPGVIYDWAQTSGTTAGNKYVPVSKQLLAHNRKASFDIFAHAARRGLYLHKLFAGKLLFMGGSTALETTPQGVRTGDLSGIVTPLIRWPLTEVYLPGKDVALESDWPAKIDKMVEGCAGRDVRGVFGMASWGLVLFEKLLARTGAQSISELWPNMKLFVHGGVRYAPFASRVRAVWAGTERGEDIPMRLELYPASEGFVAIQDADNSKAADPSHPPLRLNADHGVFYEFVPMEDAGNPSARAYTADEVEPGVRYAVVMTTPAGLWRYGIGDVVVFDSVPNGAPGAGPARLRIVGRSKLFINAFGENLIVEHIENAVVAAQEATGAGVGEFTAAPVYPEDGGRPGLELAIEWCTDPVAISAFAAAFDASLKAQNSDYTAKRSGGLGMAPPVVTTLPMGAFHEWMASRGKLGGQHKCPRCTNNRDFLEGVCAIGAGRS